MVSYPSQELENELREQGYTRIAGIDEAGRGPLAGPVVAGACWMPPGVFFPEANDSKKLTESDRNAIYQHITSDPRVIWAVGIISHTIIDEVNILQATILAMRQAIENLSIPPDYLIVDGLKLTHTLPNQKLIKGDALSHIVACASIIAKVTRDRLMLKYDAEYPQYGFGRHKGYGTEIHRKAIEKYGIAPIHRRTFAGVSGGVFSGESLR